MPNIEQEAAEAVSLLYLETLQRAKNAEAALQITRDERDDEYSRRAEVILELSTSRHITRLQEAGIEERDKKIEELVEQEDELRKSLESLRADVHALAVDLHAARNEKARLRGVLVALAEEVDDALRA